MKKLLKSTLAVSFAAMTLFSASISAGAYVVNDSNIDALYYDYSIYSGSGCKYTWGTQRLQSAFPEFSADYVGDGNVRATSNFSDQYYMFCMLGTQSKPITNFQDAAELADKIAVRDTRGQYYALQLEYDEDSNRFGLRTMLDFNTIFNSKLENYTYNSYTGEYSGDVIVDGYIAGLSISATDGLTKFSKGELKVEYDKDFDCLDKYYTVFHFTGTIPYVKDGVVFSETESSTPYKILDSLVYRYNHKGYKYTKKTDFSKEIGKSTVNKYYSGSRTGTGMTNYISGNIATNFKKNSFECYRVEGSTLYLCVGSAAFKYKSTQDNFSLYWSQGGRDAWAHNEWLVKNMDKYSTIVFTANATQTNKGTAIRYTTPAELHKLIGR